MINNKIQQIVYSCICDNPGISDPLLVEYIQKIYVLSKFSIFSARYALTGIGKIYTEGFRSWKTTKNSQTTK